jgi:hypothetical protein
MTSFLDMDEKGRRMYVARHLDLNPHDTSSWPKDVIDGVISKAEEAADRTVRDECRRIGSRGQGGKEP